MKHIIFIFFILITLNSCKKKNTPTIINATPVFVFDGVVNGENILLEAGNNNIYMYSGYYKDNQNLMTVQGYFAKDTCVNCEPFLSFEFKDKDASNNAGLYSTITDLIQSVGSGNFNSYSLDSIATLIAVDSFQFNATPNVSGASYFWDFGDGDFSFSQSPSKIYTSNGNKDIKLVVTNGTQKDSIINTIDVTTGSSCRPQFSILFDSTLNQANFTSSGFNTYSWNFGNGSFSTNQTDSSTYSLPGIYNIILNVTGTCNATFAQKLRVGNQSNNQPMASYTYASNTISYPITNARLNKLAAIITWKKNGNTYYSYKTNSKNNQTSNVVFKLNNFATYEKNINGQNTIKLEGTTDTWLYNKNNNNDSINIKSNKLVFAVAYPS